MKEIVTVKNAISDEAMDRLIQVMTDSPTIAKLANIEWKITALKPAVAWRIAKIACDINKVEKATFGDVLKGFSGNLPSVVEIITLALLNDKKRIEDEYDKVYDTLMWESKPEQWGTLLFEILGLCDVGFFFQITSATQMFRQLILERKTTTEERKLLSREQNGAK